MTTEQKLTIMKLNHLAYIARGIANTSADIPEWIRTDAARIDAKAEEIKNLTVAIATGYRVLMLPGLQED